ncbi:MAG: Lrp/AsnC family transcriptional regulator [Candidatus Hydrothermarchaeaceae archaeon]
MTIFLTAKAELGRVKGVAEGMAKIDEVSAVYLISGKFDIVAKIDAEGDAAIDLVVDKILKIPGISETRTLLAKKVK